MNEPDEGKPPVFKSWNSWYRLVLGVFILLIVLFYFLTAAFL